MGSPSRGGPAECAKRLNPPPPGQGVSGLSSLLLLPICQVLPNILPYAKSSNIASYKPIPPTPRIPPGRPIIPIPNAQDGLSWPSWPILVPSWPHFGTIMLPRCPQDGHLGPSWAHLGTMLEPSWPILASPWPIWCHLCPFSPIFGRFLSDFDRFWVPKWSQVGTKVESKIDVNFERRFFTKRTLAAAGAGSAGLRGSKLGAKMDQKSMKK